MHARTFIRGPFGHNQAELIYFSRFDLFVVCAICRVCVCSVHARCFPWRSWLEGDICQCTINTLLWCVCEWFCVFVCECTVDQMIWAAFSCIPAFHSVTSIDHLIIPLWQLPPVSRSGHGRATGETQSKHKHRHTQGRKQTMLFRAVDLGLLTSRDPTVPLLSIKYATA